ncbi:hypothetical protein ACVIRO_001069 [Rhizobium ruizarguesonis]
MEAVIPDDVKDAASAAFNEPVDDGKALWELLPSFLHDEVFAVICHAVLLERERSAMVAQNWKSPLRPGNEERFHDHQEAAREIAKAIRGEP